MMERIAGGIDETECLFTAAQYRSLWLADAATLGLVAECLAEATGWKPTDDELLPDALILAVTAAQRIAQLQQQLALYQPKLRARATTRQVELSY